MPKILHNYSLNKFILCDNNDPCWINQEIKSSLWIEKVSTLKFLTKENKNFKVLAFSIYSLRKLKYFLKVLAFSLYSPLSPSPSPSQLKKIQTFLRCLLIIIICSEKIKKFKILTFQYYTWKTQSFKKKVTISSVYIFRKRFKVLAFYFLLYSKKIKKRLSMCLFSTFLLFWNI